MHAHTSTHSYTYSFTLHTHVNTYIFTIHAHLDTLTQKDPSYSLMGAINISPFQVTMKELPFSSLPIIPLQSLPRVQVSASFTAQVLMVSTFPWAR